MGFGLVVAAAVGFGIQKGTQKHVPVADWDYVDSPNSHPVKQAGDPVPTPKNLIVAQGGVASTPDGIHVRFMGISKGNTMNPEHYWTPSGGPMEEVFDPPMGQMPDQAPRTDGRYRELAFSITADHWPVDASVLGFIPGIARMVLPEEDRIFHGWDPERALHIDRYATIKKTGVYVDDPQADSFILGLATGEWKTVDAAKNELKGPPYLGNIVAKGSWGRAVVTKAISELISSGADATKGFGSRSAIAYSKGFPTITLTIEPASGTVDDEYRLLAFDSAGVPVPLNSSRNTADISVMQVKQIASFEVQSRPFQFLKFDGVHYDPVESLWKDVVWGPNQKTQSIPVGDFSAELIGLVSTKLGNKEWNNQQYVTKTVYSVDGHVWKDHPENLSNVTESKFGIPFGAQPPKELPRPWVAQVKFHFSDDSYPRPVGRVKVFGSDSTTPGQGLHEEWNLRPSFQNLGSELIPLRSDLYVPISLDPKAKVAQLLFEVATGKWVKVFELKPDPNDIKPMGPDFRIYSLEVGPEVRVHYRAPGNTWVDKKVGDAKLDWRQVRVFARMKSGQRVPMALSSYRSEGGNEDLRPTYDLDREATETEGDMIALRDVEAFEIESRTISKGIMVVKLPDHEK